MQRKEDLLKELKSSRIQNNWMTTQWDGRKRELANALTIRAAQDEQLQLKDIEINELNSLRIDFKFPSWKKLKMNSNKANFEILETEKFSKKKSYPP